MTEEQEIARREETDKECIALGVEAKRFLASPLGRYIMERAEMVIEGNKNALATVDPEDTKAIKAIQDEIKRYSDFDQWIQEAVYTGDEVYRQFRENNE